MVARLELLVRDDDVEQGWSWRRHGLGFIAEDAPALEAMGRGEVIKYAIVPPGGEAA